MAQPYLHDHVTCVAAPATWLSGPSGRLAGGADGLYVEDRRVLSRLVVTVDAAEPVPVAVRRTGAASAQFSSVPQEPAPAGDALTLTVSRRRLAEPSGGTETITLANASHAPITVDVAVHAATDFAGMGEVRAGRAAKAAPAAGPPRATANPQEPSAAYTTGPTEHLDWHAADGMSVRIRSTPPAHIAAGADTDADSRVKAHPSLGATATLRWRATVPARGTWSAELRITRTDVPPIARPKRFSTLRVAADDRRLDALVRASVQDLDALRRIEGADAYYAAGSPWYLTLFGRDALWAARLALPLGHDAAAGTLRLLAARQGTRHDPETDEEPGRILHEVRRAGTGHTLPLVYYGTVDATPLFVSVLADAYRWGMPPAAVRALLPAAHRALGWLARHDGFVRYDSGGTGLTNQGWKDSADAVQHADGRPARGPIALSEVQAYAYRAALDGAWLLEQFPDATRDDDATGETGGSARDAAVTGRAGRAHDAAAGGEAGSTSRDATAAYEAGDGGYDAAGEAKRWREWAHDLAERFRTRFWCPGGYPAMALDGADEQVDLVASNIGHLLGTGLLTPPESAAVAERLAGLRSPFGVRTAAPASAGYNFLSYHLGSVWPHDNAVALLGLARDGHRAEASAVIAALLDAAERFDFRLPELYGGDDLPTPYPAACRPQAWAAAVGPAILTALLGLDVDVPAGRITFAPLAPSPVGAYRVRGLKVADGELDVSVTAAGELTIHNGPIGVTFHNADGTPARIGRPG
ncbi:glycogen debranching N-terminal domain-containing protein [Dactylosporangium sp. NPDC048998]|uniref:glycogen debranching N-terminal domain-containing protein n=1 Tax=Dactylosporangium sp. NPDC048998 TaxID=3363976 RepID=UPI003715A026